MSNALAKPLKQRFPRAIPNYSAWLLIVGVTAIAGACVLWQQNDTLVNILLVVGLLGAIASWLVHSHIGSLSLALIWSRWPVQRIEQLPKGYLVHLEGLSEPVFFTTVNDMPAPPDTPAFAEFPEARYRRGVRQFGPEMWLNAANLDPNWRSHLPIDFTQPTSLEEAR